MGISLSQASLWLKVDYNMCKGPVPRVNAYSAQCGHREAGVPLAWTSLGEEDWAAPWGCSPLIPQGLRFAHPLQLPSPCSQPGETSRPWPVAVMCPAGGMSPTASARPGNCCDYRIVRCSQSCSLSRFASGFPPPCHYRHQI